MRNTDEEMKRRESADVVRLTVDGARNAVNTFKEQQTGRGVSLVCPSPSLEINVPVTLGKAGSEQRRGSIHRIGVEHDPETGLPRLRLSIRTEDERETVVAAAPSILAADSTLRVTSQVAPLPAVVELLELRDDDSGDAAPAAAAEPEWIGTAAFSLPDELGNRSRTRRRHHIASTLVWTAIISMLAGGALALERAGIIDVGQLRQTITGFSMDPPRLERKSQIPAAQALAEMQLAELSEPAPEAETVAVVEPAADAPTGLASSEMAAQEAMVQLASADNNDSPEVMATEEEAAAAASVAMAPEPEQAVAAPAEASQDLTVVLPTRWPVEYATAYRVRDPNGVVIDVPGGLVKKEGWLELAEQYPMLRSIKALQRETGARFIIYTKGDELPRFITTPQKSGVSVHLSWSVSDESQDRLATL